MNIKVRHPSHCPCGEKWLGQNKENTKLTCCGNHAWEYKDGSWMQVEQKSSFLRRITRKR